MFRVVICCRRLESLVIESGRFEGEETRNFEEIQFVVGWFGDGMSRQVCIHVGERLLLNLSFPSLCSWDAIGPALVIAGVELCIIELALFAGF